MRDHEKRMDFYSFQPVLSRNGAFNSVVGARGLGKSFGAKELVIDQYIKSGREFIYLRRYFTELRDRNTFFADIGEYYPDYMFRVEGMEAQICEIEYADQKPVPWRTMGYFMSLSTSMQKKSIPYPNVYWIIFDEFIIEKGVTHYLTNEYNVFLDLYSTVDRWEDRARVLFLANSISMMNPYFTEWDINPTPADTWLTRADSFVVCHFPDSETFKKQALETRFGKFIEGSKYEEYSVQAEFKDGHAQLVGDKTEDYRYAYTIESFKGTFSVWWPKDMKTVFVSDYLPENGQVMTIEPELMRDGIQFLDRQSPFLQILKTRFNQGRLVFSSPRARNMFIELYRGR